MDRLEPISQFYTLRWRHLYMLGNIYIYNTYVFSLWIYLFSQVQP